MENARIELDIYGDAEDAEVSATIIYSKKDQFQWVGQGEDPIRPYTDGIEGVRNFIKRMKRVAQRLNLPVVLTDDFRGELRAQYESEEDIQKLQQLAEGQGCKPEQPVV